MFINATETLGKIFLHGSTNVTGNMFLSLLVIIILLIAIAIMFGIPLEFTAVIILPLLLAYMSYYGDFVTIGAVAILYLAFIFTRRFFIK